MAKRTLVIPFVSAGTPFTITTAQPNGLPGGTQGVPYASALATNGGLAPITWAKNSGSAWIALDVNGNISGTPTASGPATLSATATDNRGAQVTGAWTFQIATAATSANPIGANIDYSGMGSVRGLAMTQDGVPTSRGFTQISSLSSSVTLTASGWPATDFAVVLIEGQRVQSWMVGTWKCGFTGTGNETLTAYGSCTLTKTSGSGNPNVTFNLTCSQTQGSIVGNYAMGFEVSNTGTTYYSGSMTAGHAISGLVGFSVASSTGSISPSADTNGHAVAFAADASSQFEFGLTSGSDLGRSYFESITITGNGLNKTLLSANAATYSYSGGSSNWYWAGVIGLTSGDTYSVTVKNGSVTNVYAYVPAYGANAVTNQHQVVPLWTNETIGLYSKMASVRYMQPSDVINNTSACTAANRNTPSNTIAAFGATGTAEGYSHEFFASMSSACGVTHWMNIPIAADDTYYSSALEGVAYYMNFDGGSGGCPGLILEIGNELWNGAGAGESSGLNALANAYNSANPGVLNYDSTSNQITLSYRWLAIRLHDLCAAAQAQFGAANVGANAPVRIVFMTQAASGGAATFAPTVLSFLTHQYGGSPSQWVHALGCDTYCYRNNSSVPGDGTNYEGTSGTPTAIQQQWQRYANYGWALNSNEALKILCLKYGMKFYSYEGVGPGRIDPGQPDNSVASIGAALQDSGMNATTAYLAQQKINAGFDLLINYSSGIDTGTSAVSPYYLWDNLDTTLVNNESPRVLGLETFSSGATAAHRNQISGSGSSFSATEYIDNTNAISGINPSLTTYSGSGIEGTYDAAWIFQVTADVTYSISMSYSGSGSVNVYIDGTKVATGVSVPSGSSSVVLIASQALSTGFHYLEIGTGSYQNITPSQISFSESSGGGGDPRNLPLVNSSTPLFTYINSFQMPSKFQYGGAAISVSGSKMYVSGGIASPNSPIGAVTLPGVAQIAAGGATASLVTAPVIVPGEFGQSAADTSTRLCGSLQYGGNVYICIGLFYDAAGGNQTSWMLQANTALTSFGTPCGITPDQGNKIETFPGQLGLVPAIWQPLLGGPAFVAHGIGVSIVSTECCGYGFSTFDPAAVTPSGGSVPVTEWLNYPYSTDPGIITSFNSSALWNRPNAIGSISGNVLTVTDITITGLQIGPRSGINTASSTGAFNSIYVTANGTGTGGVGTYILSATATVPAGTAMSITNTSTSPSATSNAGGDDLASEYDGPMGFAFIPTGTRSLLFINSHHYGPKGPGFDTRNCDKNASSSNDPRRVQVTAYDLAEIIANKQAGKPVSAIAPYAWWEFPNWNALFGGCPAVLGSGVGNGWLGYDSVNQIVYGTASGFAGGPYTCYAWYVNGN